MQRLIRTCLILAVMALPSLAMAGGEARYWVTGQNIYDFEDLNAAGVPQEVTGIDLSGLNSSSRICLSDAAGNLQLFGDGRSLYDGSGKVLTTTMTGGNRAQTAVLLPDPDIAGDYLQVHTDSTGILLTSIKADGAGSFTLDESVAIDGALPADAITASFTPSRDGFYIISKVKSADEAKAFQVIKISAAGAALLDAAAPAPKSGQFFGAFSNLKITPDGTRLAYGFTQRVEGVNRPCVGLYSFNSNTAAISDVADVVLPAVVNSMGGVEFSASGRYAYVGYNSDAGTKFCQIDLHNANSIVELNTAGAFYAVGALQLSVTGDIYATIGQAGYLGRIIDPEKAVGADGCRYQAENMGVDRVTPGLPVFVSSFLRQVPAEIIIGDTPGILTVKVNDPAVGVTVDEFGLCWAGTPNPLPGSANCVVAPIDGSYTFDIRSELKAGSKYFVRAYVLGSDGKTYYGDEIELTIPDGVPPTVLMSNIRDGEAGLPGNIAICTTFSKDMDGTSFSGHVTLKDGATPVAGTVHYDNSRQLLTFLPAAELAADTVFSYTITTAVSDSSGNQLTEEHSLSFSTAAVDVDSDSDGVPDNLEDFGGDPSRVTVRTVTNTGSIELDVSALGVNLAEVRTVSDSSPAINQTGKPAAYSFIDGLLEYKVKDLAAGASITIPIIFPSGVPAGARVYKINAAGFEDVTELAVIEENRILLTLTDGGSGDADGVVNGVIDDPVGIAVPLNPEAPDSGDSNAPLYWGDSENGGPCFISSAATGSFVILLLPLLLFKRPLRLAICLLLLAVPLNAAVVKVDNLYLRTGPGIEHSAIMKLPAGTGLQVVGQDGAWLQVKLNELGGWVHGEYVDDGPCPAGDQLEPQLGQVVGDNVNFRAAPSLEAPIYARLGRNTELLVFKRADAWSLVRVAGLNGWVHADYVTVSVPEEPAITAPVFVAEEDPLVDDESGFSLAVGLGAALYGSETSAYSNLKYDLRVKNELYPVVRLAYAFDRNWSLEVAARYDWYSWELEPSMTYLRESQFRGWSLSLAPTYYFDLKGWRPFVQAGLLYRMLDGELDYPVARYKSAPGVELAAGLQLADSWELRTGLNWSRHAPERRLAFRADDLELWGGFFDISYRFDF